MLTGREKIEGAVDQISMNLIQLVKLNEELANYKVADPNVLDIRKDARLAELLDAAVLLREKILEILNEIEPLVHDEGIVASAESAIDDLRTLAEYYVYAGVKADRRIAEKYRGLIVVGGVEGSIADLYNAFRRILDVLGEHGTP
ncbi:MAG: hypothetical protein F7C35_05225 [Desulfurococcales archaeon]|nr:hypothetical protein [Desulfurococcales archaeon]